MKKLPKSMWIKFPMKLVEIRPSVIFKDGIYLVSMKSPDGRCTIGWNQSKDVQKGIDHTYDILVDIKFIKK